MTFAPLPAPHDTRCREQGDLLTNSVVLETPMVSLHVCVDQADIQKYLIRAYPPWKNPVTYNLYWKHHLSSPRHGGRRSSSMTVSDL